MEAWLAELRRLAEQAHIIQSGTGSLASLDTLLRSNLHSPQKMRLS